MGHLLIYLKILVKFSLSHSLTLTCLLAVGARELGCLPHNK